MSESPTHRLAANYSATAEDYAQCWAPVLHEMALELLPELPLTRARHVLDLGCGTGDLLGALHEAAPSARLLGVDRSPGMARVARQRTGFPVGVMDATALALPDRVYDVGVIAFVLFHVQDPAAGLREVHRVLRGGGVLGMVVWGRDSTLPGCALWTETLDAAGAPPDSRDPRVMRHEMMDTPRKLERLVASAGFAAVRVWVRRFERRWTAEGLLATQMRCGVAGRRLASLPEPRRVPIRERVLEHLTSLSPAELTYRPEVIFARAERAD